VNVTVVTPTGKLAGEVRDGHARVDEALAETKESQDVMAVEPRYGRRRGVDQVAGKDERRRRRVLNGH
jgi:hypothetical protein